MLNDFPSIPDVAHLPVKAEDIEFEPHPDRCGSICYYSDYYFAIVGSSTCSCADENQLIIMDGQASEDSHVFVEQTFFSQREAVAYAKRWIAEEHRLIQKDVEKMQELQTTVETKRPRFEDRLLREEAIDLFLMAKEGHQPVNTESPKGFAFPMFSDKKYKA